MKLGVSKIEEDGAEHTMKVFHKRTMVAETNSRKIMG